MTQKVRVISGWTIGGGGQLRELIPFSPWLILLGRFIVWWLRRPVLLAEVVLLTYLWIRLGGWVAAVLVDLAVHVALGVVITTAAWALGGTTLPMIVTGQSRRRQLRSRWADCCEAANLVRRGGGELRIPALRRVRSTPTGVRAVVLVGRVGRTTAHVAAGRESIAAVIGCREVYVRPGKHNGIALLEFAWGDPLRRTITLKDLPPPPGTDLTFGLTEDSDPIGLDPSTSALIIGLSGSGKSGVVWALVAALIRSNVPYRLIVIDPKGGMELRALRDLAYRYAVMPDDIAEVLTESAGEMRRRQEELGDAGERKYTATPSMPYTVLIVDEFLALTTFVSGRLKARIERDLGLIITQGRAPGFVGWFCSQGSQLDALGRVRTFIPQRICMATDDVETTIAALGSDARHTARCDQISLKTPGIGYMHVDGMRGLRRFRAVWITDRETRLIGRNELPAYAYTRAPVLGGRRPIHLRRRRPPRDGRTAIYAWISHDNECLYVGISNDPDRRMGEHVEDKPWVEEADHVKLVRWCDTRDEALVEEERLIKLWHPRYNIIHNNVEIDESDEELE